MAALLTWNNPGFVAKTGTAIGNLFSDMLTMFNAQSANPAYLWQVASSNVASTPYQITLKRKAGGAGRILILAYSSAPAGSPGALFASAATTNNLFIAFFPSGNVDTPSNLTSASGTIMGDDTGVCGAASLQSVSSNYTTSVQVSYFDSDGGVLLTFQNPATTNSVVFGGAGWLVVDASDTEYPCAMGTHATSFLPGATSGNPFAWQPTPTARGSASTGAVFVFYGGSQKPFYHAWIPAGQWALQTVGAGPDILVDSASTRVWFLPIPLLSNTKGEGMVLKFRQIAIGPGTTGAFQPYNTTGPVVAARNINGCTTGGIIGHGWVTNFRV